MAMATIWVRSQHVADVDEVWWSGTREFPTDSIVGPSVGTRHYQGCLQVAYEPAAILPSPRDSAHRGLEGRSLILMDPRFDPPLFALFRCSKSHLGFARLIMSVRVRNG